MTLETSHDLDTFADRLQLSGKEANQVAADVLDHVTQQVLTDYRADIPERTGRTKRGAAREKAVIGGPFEFGTVRADVGNTHFVARFLEEGRPRQRPQPFLDRAVRRATPMWRSRLAVELANTLPR